MKVNSFILDLLQAKRDPYRFRFPLEMRLVDPNIDHLLYVFSSRIPSLFFIKIFFVILVSFTSLIGWMVFIILICLWQSLSLIYSGKLISSHIVHQQNFVHVTTPYGSCFKILIDFNFQKFVDPLFVHSEANYLYSHWFEIYVFVNVHADLIDLTIHQYFIAKRIQIQKNYGWLSFLSVACFRLSSWIEWLKFDAHSLWSFQEWSVGLLFNLYDVMVTREMPRCLLVHYLQSEFETDASKGSLVDFFLF